MGMEIRPGSGIMEAMDGKEQLAFVIEDDRNLAQAFAQAFIEADYAVEVLMDGNKAVTRLIETNPTTVLLDLHIPYVSGMDILELIKSNTRFADTKVIVATADERKAEELHDLADLVLIKPIGFRQLRDLAIRLHPKNH